jgi:hypothetical protein
LPFQLQQFLNSNEEAALLVICALKVLVIVTGSLKSIRTVQPVMPTVPMLVTDTSTWKKPPLLLVTVARQDAAACANTWPLNSRLAISKLILKSDFILYSLHASFLKEGEQAPPSVTSSYELAT